MGLSFYQAIMFSPVENMPVRDIGQSEFDSVIEKSQNKLVVVEFYTETCPNCAAMVPVYEEVAKNMSRDADFFTVNASANQELALRFGVMGVPAFKFFCNGKEVAGTVGETNVTALTNTVKDLVKYGTQCISKSTILKYEMDGYG